MAKHNCEKCNFRARYDNNQKSFLGWLWKWHIGWCSGWRWYMTSLPTDEGTTLAEKYDYLSKMFPHKKQSWFRTSN